MDFQALVSTEESTLIRRDPSDQCRQAGCRRSAADACTKLTFKALPSALVEKIELDIGDLKVGDTIRVADLDIAKDKDVDLTTDRKQPS